MQETPKLKAIPEILEEKWNEFTDRFEKEKGDWQNWQKALFYYLNLACVKEPLGIRKIKELRHEGTSIIALKMTKSIGILLITNSSNQALSNTLGHAKKMISDYKLQRVLMLRPRAMNWPKRGKAAQICKQIESKGGNFQFEQDSNVSKWMGLFSLLETIQKQELMYTDSSGEEILIAESDLQDYLGKYQKNPFLTIQKYLKKFYQQKEEQNTAFTDELKKKLDEMLLSPPGYLHKKDLEEFAKKNALDPLDVTAYFYSHKNIVSIANNKLFVPVSKETSKQKLPSYRIRLESREAENFLDDVLSNFLSSCSGDAEFVTVLEDYLSDKNLSKIWNYIYGQYFIPFYMNSCAHFSALTYEKLCCGLHQFCYWLKSTFLENLESKNISSMLEKTFQPIEKNLRASWHDNIILGSSGCMIIDPKTEKPYVISFKLGKSREDRQDIIPLALAAWLLKKSVAKYVGALILFLDEENYEVFSLDQDRMEEICETDWMEQFIHQNLSSAGPIESVQEKILESSVESKEESTEKSEKPQKEAEETEHDLEEQEDSSQHIESEKLEQSDSEEAPEEHFIHMEEKCGVARFL